jgi:transposase InsO family protein
MAEQIRGVIDPFELHELAAKDYQNLLRDYGMLVSMSRKGNCWDNAPMESANPVCRDSKHIPTMRCILPRAHRQPSWPG